MLSIDFRGASWTGQTGVCIDLWEQPNATCGMTYHFSTACIFTSQSKTLHNGQDDDGGPEHVQATERLWRSVTFTGRLVLKLLTMKASAHLLPIPEYKQDEDNHRDILNHSCVLAAHCS